MKLMVEELVYEVRRETRGANISHAGSVQKQEAVVEKKKAEGILSEVCPKCKKANLIKGKSAYGCGDYKAGCRFVLPYTFADKKISENQYLRLLQKGSTVNLKDFKTDAGAVEGLLRFDKNFELKLEQKKTVSPTLSTEKKPISDALECPKCKKGRVLKGKTAFGCSDYKSGCDFKVSFEVVRAKLKDQKPTKELVNSILCESF
jgi:DNA topoisomerase-3